MNSTAMIGRFLTMVSLSIGMANATVISDFTDFLTATSATQTGRLSRNGIPQDWSGGELFPGVINTGTVYHYQTYVVNVGITPFIQIDVDSLATTTFVSVYDGGYAPDSAGSPNFGFDTHWLGDAGTSGDTFGTDPLFFQVLPSAHDNIVIVVNQTSAGTSPGAGIGSTNPFHITVEGFIDSEFDDPAPTPEPSALFLSGGGLLLLPLIARLRRRGNRKAQA